MILRTARLALAPLALLTLGSGSIRAQDPEPGFTHIKQRPEPHRPPRLDLSFGGGVSFSTDWSDQLVLETRHATGGRTIRLLLPEVVMAPGPVLGGGVGYWRGELGVRLHGSFAAACLTAGETRCDDEPETETPDRFVTDVDVWTYGIQGLIGLTRGRLARAVRPYVVIGASGMTFDPAEPVPGVGVPEGETIPGTGGDVIVVDGTSDLVLSVDRLGFETRLAGELGIGVDLRIPLGAHGIGARLELIDQLTTSPLGATIERLDGGARGGTRVVVEAPRPVVHTLRATIAAMIDIGLPAPAPGPVASTVPVADRIDSGSGGR